MIDYKETLSIKSHVKMGVLNEKRCKKCRKSNKIRNSITISNKIRNC